MKKYTLLFVLFPYVLFAQNNGDSLKFEIIKATVNFYTTDSVAYYKFLNGKSLNCASLDYNCISTFCNQNDVGSILKKVEEWEKNPSNSEVDLQKLTKKIEDELQKKEYRSKLESYKKFKELVAKLSASYRETKDDTNSGDVVTPEKVAKNETQATGLDNDKDGRSDSLLPLIAIILAGLALVLSFISFFRNKATSRADNGFEMKSGPDYNTLKDDISKLNNRLSQKQSQTVDLKPLEDRIKKIEDRLSGFESQPRTVDLVVERKEEIISNKGIVTPPSSKTVFAKLPDAGNGFSQSIIADNQNGEQIYEIEINNDRATFAIASEPNAQKYALSDFNYYLSNACDFINQPVKNCKIYTQEKGTLTKSGGNWVIQNKAKIEFK